MMLAGMDLSEKLLAGVALFEMKLFLFQMILFQTVGMMVGFGMVGFGMIEYGMVGFETVEAETLGKVNQVHFVMVCKLQTWVYLQVKQNPV